MRSLLLTCAVLLFGCAPARPLLRAPSVKLVWQGRASSGGDFVVPEGAPPARPFTAFSDGEVRAKLGPRLSMGKVRIGGKRLPFADYLALVNAYEQFFAELGSSLRDPDDSRVLLALRPRPPASVQPVAPAEPPARPPGDPAERPRCLFHGNLDVDWRGARVCADPQSGAGGWFAVDLCGSFSALINWISRDHAFSIHSGQNLEATLVLFGVRMAIARLHGDVDWLKMHGERGLGPQPGSSYSIAEATQQTREASQELAGPRVEFAVGPEPMSLDSKALVFGAVAPTEVQLSPYPEECTTPAEGRLEFASHSRLRVSSTPARGQSGASHFALGGALELVDDGLEAHTSFAIRPARGEVTVAPSFNVQAQRGRGALELTVETDLVIARKRWRIALSSGGAPGGTSSYTVPARTFSAE